MKAISGILIYALLCACATSSNYNNKLNKMVGQPESALIALWGQPNSVFKLGNQEEIITYVRKNEEIIPPSYTIYNPDFNSMDTLYSPFSYQEDFALPTSVEPGYVINNICQTSFHIKNGIIQSWQWRGNNCVSF